MSCSGGEEEEEDPEFEASLSKFRQRIEETPAIVAKLRPNVSDQWIEKLRSQLEEDVH
jgi:hypothetical protein